MGGRVITNFSHEVWEEQPLAFARLAECLEAATALSLLSKDGLEVVDDHVSLEAVVLHSPLLSLEVHLGVVDARLVERVLARPGTMNGGKRAQAEPWSAAALNVLGRAGLAW